jgi:gluconolactonase
MKKLSVFFLFLFIAAGFWAVRAQTPPENPILKMDPALDEIVPAGGKLEKVVTGFTFLEGPVWVPSGKSGYLLFSDIPANLIQKWTPDGTVSVYLKPSGFTGADSSNAGGEYDSGHGKFYQFGSNAVTIDHEGRVVFCAHGDRMVVRVEPDGKRTILADRFEGKRFNSPNDLVYKSDGALYFTDPTGGLRGRDDDPRRELTWQGVYLLKGGKLQLVVKDLALPNGLAFSPDEKYLYVDNSAKKTIMRYDVAADDTLSSGKVFADMAAEKGGGNPDGMKIDRKGNIYCTGPGGVLIYSPDGKYLGKISTPEVAANLAWGDDGGKTLYVTARSSLYRIRLNVPGIRP